MLSVYRQSGRGTRSHSKDIPVKLLHADRLGRSQCVSCPVNSRIPTTNPLARPADRPYSSSLTFRTRETQDLLFSQLQKLQEAVNRSMQASARQSDRQSANLGHLALTAQRFYNAASSTAGTQVGGSEAASVLASRRRESIGIWRDGLPPVQESPEAAPSDDASTMRTDADEESDVELDVLRNLEVLAHANFVARDYSAAERCLQKVLNRATSGNRDLGLLKTQLAFCCCLQGRWEQATTTMDPLPETDSGPAFLPALHILQAVSMVHLRQQRLDDAEATCMVVVNGKKSALGKEHDGYYESLSILSAIWRRRGDLMVSEAVCLNIPRDWRPPLDITELSPRRYILRHRTVLDSVFPDRATGNYPPLPALSATLGSVRLASAPASGASRHRLQFLPSRQENWSENHPTQQVTGSRLNAGIHLATTVIPTTKARLDDDGENITPCKVLELPIARPRASAPGAQRSSLRLPLQPLPASPLNLSGPTQQRNVLGYELPALAENRLRTSRSGYLVESQALALRHELRKMRSANFGYSTSPNH